MYPSQLDLFAHVAAAYTDTTGGRMTNRQLYATVAERAGIPVDQLETREPVGRSGQRHSLLQRAVRWHQQTLKHAGVLQRVPEGRGIWELSERSKKGLHSPLTGVRLVAFSTTLGVAIWGDGTDVFDRLDAPISLCVSSPPYLLAKPRDYGNPASERDYIEFIIAALKPIARNLVPGGSICLNISNDCFVPGTPARSMYVERLLLAIHDRLGLHLMDRLVWHNPSKAPGPVRWASMTRQQLNVSYEPIYWFSNDPLHVRANNRQVLEPHTAKHGKLIAAGGEVRTARYANGAYTIHPGRFSNQTEGKIPRNVITRGHRCADSIQYRKDAEALDLPVHGAVQPLSIPDFLIRFLSEAGDLVVDPFGGTAKTARAAENLGRRWVVAEKVIDYLRGAAERFRGCDGFDMPDGVARWPEQRASALPRR